MNKIPTTVDILQIEVRAIVERAIADLKRVESQVENVKKKHVETSDSIKKFGEMFSGTILKARLPVEQLSAELTSFGTIASVAFGAAVAAGLGFFYWLSRTSPVMSLSLTSMGYAFDTIGIKLGTVFAPQMATVTKGTWDFTRRINAGIDAAAGFSTKIHKWLDDLPTLPKLLSDIKMPDFTLPDIVTSLTTWLSGISTKFTEGLTGLETSWGTTFGNIKTSLSKWFDDIWNNYVPQWFKDWLQPTKPTTTGETTVTTGGGGTVTGVVTGPGTVMTSTGGMSVVTGTNVVPPVGTLGGATVNPFTGGTITPPQPQSIVSPTPNTWVQNTVDAIGQGISNTINNISNNASNLLNSIGGLFGFQEGGIVPKTGLIYAHRGEFVVPANQVNSTTSNQTINFNPTIYMTSTVRLGQDQWAKARDLSEQWYQDLKRWTR